MKPIPPVTITRRSAYQSRYRHHVAPSSKQQIGSEQVSATEIAAGATARNSEHGRMRNPTLRASAEVWAVK